MSLYLFSVQHDYAATWSEEDTQAMYARVGAVNEELRNSGAWVFAGGLLPPDSATVVRVAGGAATMTDGPFAETKEQLGGFWVLDFADLDAALPWAKKCAEACAEPIEVRPFEGEA